MEMEEFWKTEYKSLYKVVQDLRLLTGKQNFIQNKKDGSFVCVSSIYTMDAGFESMVFPSDGKTILDFSNLEERHYETYAEMGKGHEELCKKWGDK